MIGDVTDPRKMRTELSRWRISECLKNAKIVTLLLWTARIGAYNYANSEKRNYCCISRVDNVTPANKGQKLPPEPLATEEMARLIKASSNRAQPASATGP